MGFTLAQATTIHILAYNFRARKQSMIWLEAITPGTPGVTTSAGWDPSRQQEPVFSDGSYGMGLQVVQNGIIRRGYLAPVHIVVGFDDTATTQVASPDGRISYESPTVYYQRPTVLAKSDVLVLDTDGRRFVVADELSISQVFGTTVLVAAKLEQRDTHDLIYQIPLI